MAENAFTKYKDFLPSDYLREELATADQQYMLDQESKSKMFGYPDKRFVPNQRETDTSKLQSAFSYLGLPPEKSLNYARDFTGRPEIESIGRSLGVADFTGYGPLAYDLPQNIKDFKKAREEGSVGGQAMSAGFGLLNLAEVIPIAGLGFKAFNKPIKGFAKSISEKLNNIDTTPQLGALPSNKVLANTAKKQPSMAMVNPKLSLDDIKNKYSNVDLDVYNDPKGLTLSKIVVSEGVRSEGIGSNVMNDLIKYADENNKPIALTPDNSFGGSKTRLESFYKKFGFKENKGRNKDFAFRETMIRQPKVSQEKRKLILDNRRKEANIARFGYDPNETVDTSYRMQHTPNPEGARLDDMTGGGEYFPDDIYSSNGLKFYGDPNNKFDRESFDVIQSVKGNPEAEVTIYRAVPNEDNINTINSGDFVTLSKEYADMHGASGYGIDGQEAGKIISQKVKVKHLRSDGNDLNEFGYFPENKGDIAKAIPPTEKSEGILAFHGSASDFDEFKLSKIGTGEGAQAFGDGLYFTDSKDIAKFYRDGVRGFKDLQGKVEYNYKGKIFKLTSDTAKTKEELGVAKILENAISTNRYPEKAKENLIKILEKDIKTAQSRNDTSDISDLLIKSYTKDLDSIKNINISNFEQSKGKMYKVKIDAVMNDLVDYDKPLGNQNNNVKDVLDKMSSEVTIDDAINFGFDPNDQGSNLFLYVKKGSDQKTIEEAAIKQTVKNLFGKDQDVVTFLNNWGSLRGSRNSGEKLLNKYGIKGIKYDAGKISGKESDATNYVIFDDKIIDIMAKYGIVGAVGVKAMENSNDQSIGALGSLPNDQT